jgi:hypothetical protein
MLQLAEPLLAIFMIWPRGVACGGDVHGQSRVVLVESQSGQKALLPLRFAARMRQKELT